MESAQRIFNPPRMTHASNPIAKQCPWQLRLLAGLDNATAVKGLSLPF
jgi:hypothetical protein